MNISSYMQLFESKYDEQYETAKHEYNQTHALRFFNSFHWIKDYLPNAHSVLELGDRSLFSFIVESEFPPIHISYTSSDLRYGIDLSDQSFDFILNMEVIEHIKDREPSPDQINKFWEISEFTMNGLNTLMSECYRLLKSDGLMFITTPNLNSLDNIHRILNHLPPINYYPHVREYSIGELLSLAENHRFKVLKLETFNNWNEYKSGSRDEILRLLYTHELPLENRGDDIFLLLQKP